MGVEGSCCQVAAPVASERDPALDKFDHGPEFVLRHEKIGERIDHPLDLVGDVEGGLDGWEIVCGLRRLPSVPEHQPTELRFATQRILQWRDDIEESLGNWLLYAADGHVKRFPGR